MIKKREKLESRKVPARLTWKMKSACRRAWDAARSEMDTDSSLITGALFPYAGSRRERAGAGFWHHNKKRQAHACKKFI
jgi:hypothetical protein